MAINYTLSFYGPGSGGAFAASQRTVGISAKILAVISSGANALSQSSSQIQSMGPNGVLAIFPIATFTCTSIPSIPDGYDAQSIYVVNVNTSQSFTLQDQGLLSSSNLRLMSSAASTMTFAPRQICPFVFSADVGDWIQAGPLVTTL